MARVSKKNSYFELKSIIEDAGKRVRFSTPRQALNIGSNTKVKMGPSNYKITRLQSNDNIPFDLLLLADETKEAIEKYIYNSEVFIVTASDHLHPIAVFALYKTGETEIEIKNIAVSEELQGKGIGSYLVSEIKRIAIADKFESIIVGTPDIGLREINFYEKNGFTKYGVKKNFFRENYTQPIIEDGVMLSDMVMLKMKL